MSDLDFDFIRNLFDGEPTNTTAITPEDDIFYVEPLIQTHVNEKKHFIMYERFDRKYKFEWYGRFNITQYVKLCKLAFDECNSGIAAYVIPYYFNVVKYVAKHYKRNKFHFNQYVEDLMFKMERRDKTFLDAVNRKHFIEPGTDVFTDMPINFYETRVRYDGDVPPTLQQDSQGECIVCYEEKELYTVSTHCKHALCEVCIKQIIVSSRNNTYKCPYRCSSNAHGGQYPTIECKVVKRFPFTLSSYVFNAVNVPGFDFPRGWANQFSPMEKDKIYYALYFSMITIQRRARSRLWPEPWLEDSIYYPSCYAKLEPRRDVNLTAEDYQRIELDLIAERERYVDSLGAEPSI
jgi:hypothetical protein